MYAKQVVIPVMVDLCGALVGMREHAKYFEACIIVKHARARDFANSILRVESCVYANVLFLFIEYYYQSGMDSASTFPPVSPHLQFSCKAVYRLMKSKRF